MRTLVIAASAALLAACGSQDASGETAAQSSDDQLGAATSPAAQVAQRGPDLASCPKREPIEEGLRQRTAAIAIPAPLAGIARADLDNIAVSTTGGATVCVDASWMESLRDAALSPNQRFASFGWDAYESYGHVVVDRSGQGQVIDTGVAPLRSPSGKRFAAVEYSESGFGSLNAFAVWDVRETGLSEVAKVEDLPPEHSEWRLDRWGGEDCVELSAVAYEDMPEDYRDIAKAPRERFAARASGRWQVQASASCRAA